MQYIFRWRCSFINCSLTLLSVCFPIFRIDFSAWNLINQNILLVDKCCELLSESIADNEIIRPIQSINEPGLDNSESIQLAFLIWSSKQYILPIYSEKISGGFPLEIYWTNRFSMSMMCWWKLVTDTSIRFLHPFVMIYPWFCRLAQQLQMVYSIHELKRKQAPGPLFRR